MLNELNLFIMCPEDIVRWYQPQTDVEQYLVDALSQDHSTVVCEQSSTIRELEDDIENREDEIRDLEEDIRALELQNKDMTKKFNDLEVSYKKLSAEFETAKKYFRPQPGINYD